MKVIISGGAGFIGSYLCEEFIKCGDDVYVLDNLSTGKRSNILEVINRGNFVLGNVENESDVQAFKNINFDIVMHFASPASPTAFKKIPIDILNANIAGTKNMLDLAKRSNARFIFASTSEVYGNPPINVLPLHESYNGNVNCIGVRGCYDEGKRAGEAYCKAYERIYGMDIGIVRIFNTYGPRMPDDGRAIPTFIKQALAKKTLTIFGSGHQTRAFLYIDDLVDGIMKYVTTIERPSPLNLGAISQTSIIDLADMIQNIVGVPSAIRFLDKTEDDPDYRLPNIEDAEESLEWEPKTDLIKGLKNTIDYFKSLKY